MGANPYESERLLAEYLLFHYGKPDELLPWDFGPKDALFFPKRCVELFASLKKNQPVRRALDLGCAVGGATFELARFCPEVVGIDFSESFIRAADGLKKDGAYPYQFIAEGDGCLPGLAAIPPEIDRARVRFETGDAMNLRGELGKFDSVLAANLLCRLRDPRALLQRLPDLVLSGGELVMTTPCTWSEEWTPHQNWLFEGHETGSTLLLLRKILEPSFHFQRAENLPFVIREHARKFQWCVAQASIWVRR